MGMKLYDPHNRDEPNPVNLETNRIMWGFVAASVVSVVFVVVQVVCALLWS